MALLSVNDGPVLRVGPDAVSDMCIRVPDTHTQN